MASPASGTRSESDPAVGRPRVAFQGEPGAFSEEGVLSAFASPLAVALPTWRAVFEAIHAGTVDAGVVPIERSQGGSAADAKNRCAVQPEPDLPRIAGQTGA